MSRPQTYERPHYRVNAVVLIRPRSSLPWRVAAVVAVAVQFVASICGLLLLVYWVVTSIALID